MQQLVWHPYNVTHLSPVRKRIFSLCKKEPSQNRNSDCMKLYVSMMSNREFIDKWKSSFTPWTQREIDSIKTDIIKIDFRVVEFVQKLKKKRQAKKKHFEKQTESSKNRYMTGFERQRKYNHFVTTLRS